MTIAASPKLHPTTRYAKAVTDGEIVAGEMVRLACARHLSDLDRQGSEDFPYWFSEAAANRRFDFFEFKLCHYEGDLDGQPFDLLGWQMFVVGSLSGWVDSDGNRRFRTAYTETGKGSGKTPLGAGMALAGLVDDDEPGAQVYCAATTREQAGLGFKDAKAMARKSPELSGMLHITEHAITFENSYFQTVSSEAGNLHGKRPHVALIDEVHVHPDDSVIEALRAGTKGRRQALMFMITNSGMDRRSLAWRYREYSYRVVSGTVTDEQWFAYVCQLDVCAVHKAEGKDMPVDNCEGCDQWTDESVWLKANPSLPVVPGYRYLREQVNEAVGMPAKQDIVKRLNFCIWTTGKVAWIRPELWKAQDALKDIEGRTGYGGYDFAAVNDLTAAMYIFPDEDGNGIDILRLIFLPEERVESVAARTNAPFHEWVRQGLIITTPGQTMNYNFVKERDREIRERYQIDSSGIDPWQSIQFRADLEADGIKIEKVPQTNQRLHAVVEEAERLLSLHGFRHGGDPVLEWCASNVVLNIDGRGMKRLSKDASAEKIDPMQAVINALSVAMESKEESGDLVFSFGGNR